MAHVIYRPAFWILLIVLFGLAGWLGRRLKLRWWPAWALRSVMFGLILMAIFSPQGELLPSNIPIRQVLLVDQSDSLSDKDRQNIKDDGKAWLSEGQNRLVVAFGDQPSIVIQPQENWPVIDGRATNIVQALNLADELLGSDPGRIILATDGLVQNPEQVGIVVTQLGNQNHVLDILPLSTRDTTGDTSLGRMQMPGSLWEGTPFEITLPIYLAEGTEEIDWRVKINDQVVDISPEQIENQPELVKFEIPPQLAGIITLEILAETQDDPFPQNNKTFATLQIFDSPKVLFVTSSPVNENQSFIDKLNQNGIEINTVTPQEFPTRVEELRNYKVIFLDDLLASELTKEQMLSIQFFVSNLGGGMIILGGNNSYTLGGYKNTLLEPMLPVELEAPPRSQRPPVVFVLVLDHSSSMENQQLDVIQPIDLAREAAMRAIETLKPEDHVGVLTFDADYQWDVVVRSLGSGLRLREALDAVSRVQAEGGTKMYIALQEAITVTQTLPPSAPQSRYILLLSDGKSSDGDLQSFAELAQEASNQNVTISTIALGSESDQDVMSVIAEEASGRYYAVNRAEDLPMVMVSESKAARSENIQSGQIGLEPGVPEHPILSGLSISRLPYLNSYNAVISRAKDGAEDVLLSASLNDPILSVWQNGLGRVVAWMSDSGDEWTEKWQSEADEGKFWSQVVRYALPNPSLGQAEITTEIDATQLTINASFQESISAVSNTPLDIRDLQFIYVDGEGKGRAYTMPQVGAGVYRLVLPRPVDGAYRGIVTYTNNPDGDKVELPASFAINPPAEWQISDVENRQSNLTSWAMQTGGRIIQPEELIADIDNTAVSTTNYLNTWWWLILVLIIYWPMEIAIRRRWLPWI